MELKSSAEIKGSYRIRTWDKDTGKLIWDSGEIKNLIVNSLGYGLDIFTRQLGGDTTYAIEIDSAKIGTGTTAPTSADTDLETAVLSGITVASTSFSVGSVTISFFIPDANLANGTYNEFGIFANGRLFARSIITPAFVKGSNQNTTVDYTITVTAP